MASKKQRFRLRSVLGIILGVIAAFLIIFDVLPLHDVIAILAVGLALIAVLAAPRRAKKP